MRHPPPTADARRVQRVTVTARAPWRGVASLRGVTGERLYDLQRPAARVAVALFALLALPAAAVLIASEDGSGNDRAPSADFPWDHVGRCGEFSALYLGNRWVLTAGHVGATAVAFGDQLFRPVAGSNTALRNEDGSASDLVAFRIDAADGPPLGLLPLARDRPEDGEQLFLVGRGHDRSEALEWRDASDRALRGWHAAPTRSMRWGTNRLDGDLAELEFRGTTTRVLAMGFSAPDDATRTDFEAQAVAGDSGGAVFVRRDDRFELAGILIVRTAHSGQPEGAALFGNRSFAADLSAYRAQLVALTRPDCSDERDNDSDGWTDHPDDPGCSSPSHDSEFEPSSDGADSPAQKID